MKVPVIAAALALVLVPAAQASTGSQLWAQEGCGSCHTLGAAGSYGSAGPNLDQLQPSADRVARQITNGGAAMPSFAGSLSSSQIAALAAYVASSTGSGAVSAAAPAAPTTVAPTMSKAVVMRIQRALHRLGYFNGPVTGTYGPLTTAAVGAFQQASGLTADGVWGPATKAALAGAAASTAGTTASSTTGLPPPKAWVKRLQVDLGKLGYFNGPDTGVYGPITTAAIKSFQAAVGLTADGRWGPQSQSALVSRLG
jgi:peptidoglycan hydrolase-like protein with peptidoglycan-binding domain